MNPSITINIKPWVVFRLSRALLKAIIESGPSGKPLDSYCDWLIGCGFKRTTVRIHLANDSHLNAYLAMQKEREMPALSEEDLSKFSKEYRSLARNLGFSEYHVRRVQWSINRFVLYLRRQKLFEPPIMPN